MSGRNPTIEKDDEEAIAARSPAKLPRRAWFSIARCVWRDFSEDRLSMVGAGTAFYILLALVPALSAFVAVYGLIFDRVSVVEQVASLSSLLAPEVRSVIEGQLTRLASESSGSLGVAFAVSLTLSLWSASAGIKALMDGLNIVYAEEEKRGFVQYYATALVLTLAGLVGFVAIIAATVAVPLALDYVAPGQAGGFVRTASYVVLLGFLWVGLITLYRWGPSREHAKWRWLAPGTIAAMVALAIFAMLFSWFARTFAGYASYGSLGAIIAFMTWVWISTVIVLLGAEINAEVEYRTTHDTTIGPARPMGERGAVMADSAPGTHQVRHSRSEPTR